MVTHKLFLAWGLYCYWWYILIDAPEFYFLGPLSSELSSVEFICFINHSATSCPLSSMFMWDLCFYVSTCSYIFNIQYTTCIYVLQRGMSQTIISKKTIISYDILSRLLLLTMITVDLDIQLKTFYLNIPILLLAKMTLLFILLLHIGWWRFKNACHFKWWWLLYDSCLL